MPHSFALATALACALTASCLAGDTRDGSVGRVDAPNADNDAPALLTGCELEHGAEVGEQFLVIDWLCPVAERCGVASLVADCGNSTFYCHCVDRYQQCEELAPPGEGVCPQQTASNGSDCLLSLWSTACEDGSYCQPDAQEDSAWGTCQALPELCGPRACYTDKDCADFAETHDVHARCDGAQPETATMGECRPRPSIGGTCSTNADCPKFWKCEGTAPACDDLCSCELPTSGLGTCEPKVGGYHGPILWLPNADALIAGTEVVPHWLNANHDNTSTKWFGCPLYTVEIRDEVTYRWSTLLEVACTDGTSIREIGPGHLTALPSFKVPELGPLGITAFRVRSSHYEGCDGVTDVEDCEVGPYDHGQYQTYRVRARTE